VRRRKTLSRSGASPEMVDSSVPGAKTTRVWVWEMVRDMGNPLEPKVTAQAASLAGARRAGTTGWPTTPRSSLTGVKGRCGAHRGLGTNIVAMQEGCRRRPAAAHGRSSRSGRYWVPPGAWIPRAVSWFSCEDATEVRADQGPPAASKWSSRR